MGPCLCSWPILLKPCDIAAEIGKASSCWFEIIASTPWQCCKSHTCTSQCNYFNSSWLESFQIYSWHKTTQWLKKNYSNVTELIEFNIDFWGFTVRLETGSHFFFSFVANWKLHFSAAKMCCWDNISICRFEDNIPIYMHTCRLTDDISIYPDLWIIFQYTDDIIYIS